MELGAGVLDQIVKVNKRDIQPNNASSFYVGLKVEIWHSLGDMEPCATLEIARIHLPKTAWSKPGTLEFKEAIPVDVKRGDFIIAHFDR